MKNEANNLVKPWHGVPREDIKWYPRIVSERCIGCGLCVTSCGRGVYRFDYENNVAIVANSLHCMVGCSTCATICPREAIEFPSRGYIQQLIREHKIIGQSQDLLRADPEQYSVRKLKRRTNRRQISDFSNCRHFDPIGR